MRAFDFDSNGIDTTGQQTHFGRFLYLALWAVVRAQEVEHTTLDQKVSSLNPTLSMDFLFSQKSTR